LGEILKNKKKVAELLGAEKNLELMAVVALGHLAKKLGEGERDLLDQRVFLKR
jgi:hypothetical protein